MRKNERSKTYLMGVITITSIFSVVLWIALRSAGKGSWWIDTIITFPLGMWYSFYRNDIEQILRDKYKGVLSIIALAIGFVGWHLVFGNDIFGLCACIFALMVVALSTRIKVDNKVLQWLGVQSFAIYIMQRLPMNLFQHMGLNDNPYLFAVISIPAALLIAWLFNQVLIVVDRRL